MAPRATLNFSLGELDIAKQLMGFMIPQALDLEIKRNFARFIEKDLRSGIQSAAAGGTVGATGRVTAFAEGLKRKMENPADMAQIHQEVAAQMRTAVMESFRKSGQTKVGPYRVGGAGDYKRVTAGGFLSRYSGGSLRRALSNPSLAVGDAKGISYVDEGRLTREAAHWARLNFGALGSEVPDRRKTRYRFIFDQRVVGSIGFDVNSRPAFYLPPGRWLSTEGKWQAGDAGRRGMDRFYPGRVQRSNTIQVSVGNYGRTRSRKQLTGLNRMRTRGIMGREFLNAGLYAMATNLPIRYSAILDKWMKESDLAATAPSIVVRPGEIPRALPIRYRSG